MSAFLSVLSSDNISFRPFLQKDATKQAKNGQKGIRSTPKPNETDTN